MSINLQVFNAFSSRTDDRPIQGGSIHKPVNFSLTGDWESRVETIANGANAVVYNNTLTSFDFLWAQSDYNTRMLITDTNSNTFSIHLRGTGVDNEYGIPFILAFDESDGGNAIINTIQVFNTSGNSAKVLCIVGQ